MSTPPKAPLLAIRPDPDQPRTLLPADLVGLFTNGLMSPQAIMTQWQKSPNQALNAIVTLADSIAQHGQINPISVQPTQSLPGVQYLIVTGERRWWAHVLLLTQGRLIIEGDCGPSPLASTRHPADQIKISMVTKGVSIRAHQLIENVVREDLGAVEKAHGMWALRYELSGKNFSSVLPTSAQEKYLVGWDQVEQSLGVSSRYRQYVTGVLKLTPDALRLVAEHGLSESTIRPITQKLHKHADLQIKALMQLVAWQESEDKHSLIKEVKQMVSELVAKIPKVGETPRPSLLPLELSQTKKAKVPSAPKPALKPTPEPTLGPTPASTPKHSPTLTAHAAPAPVHAPMPLAVLIGAETQKPLIEGNLTLRNRPPSTDLGSFGTHRLLSEACARLECVLDQIDTSNPPQNLTDNKEQLMRLKARIDQLLK